MFNINSQVQASYNSPFILVVPAYGREYKNQKEVKKAWQDGQDFVIVDVSNPYYGKYINKEDAEREGSGVQAVNVRYANLTKVCVINVGGKRG